MAILRGGHQGAPGVGDLRPAVRSARRRTKGWGHQPGESVEAHGLLFGDEAGSVTCDVKKYALAIELHFVATTFVVPDLIRDPAVLCVGALSAASE